jgi:hypothetical protein
MDDDISVSLVISLEVVLVVSEAVAVFVVLKEATFVKK